MLSIESANAKRLINLYLAWFSYRQNGMYIAKRTRLFADTHIARGTRINGPALIKGEGKAEIGKYCAIGDNLTVITSNHTFHNLNLQNALQVEVTGNTPFKSEKADVRIGHNVWVGDNVIILPGVEIGNGAIIGAGSVVTRSVPPFQITAGNPAKRIGERFTPEISNRLSEIHWWDWSAEEMRSNKDLFMSDFSTMTNDEIDNLFSTINSHRE